MKGTVEMALPAPPSRPSYQRNGMDYPRYALPVLPPTDTPPSGPKDYQPALSLQWENPTDTKSGNFEAAVNEKNQATLSFALSVPPKSVFIKQTFDGVEGWKDQVLYGRESGLWRVENSKSDKMPASEIESLKKMANLSSLVNHNSPQAEWRGKANVNGRLAYHIESIDKAGEKVQLFFDAETSLLVAAEAAVAKEAKTLLMTIFFDDYREIKGLKMPFSLKYKIKADGVTMWFAMKLDKLSLNEQVDASLFAKANLSQIILEGGVQSEGGAKTSSSVTTSPRLEKETTTRRLPSSYESPSREAEPRQTPPPREKPARPAKSGNGLFEGMIPPRQ
jgi:hypothetical protein